MLNLGGLNLGGLELAEHTFQVPLDYSAPERGTIEVFAREAVLPGERAAARPWLVFLQGGPGFESPRPLGKEGWIGAAVEHYRVLLLDQRGTGRSSPQTPATILGLGDAKAQAAHLGHFRADSIVRDCESIREAMGVRRWTVLGQSFGGFCAVHYLSTAPESLAGAMITGGLPGLDVHADDVYRRTYALTRTKNERMWSNFPGIRKRIQRVFRRVAEGDVVLPSGDLLTLERLQAAGAQLGFSRGAAELHYLLERALVPGSDELSRSFLRGVEGYFAFDTNPFYAILHEACYGQGRATRWSAMRIREEFPEFDAKAALAADRAPLFTGEMVYPWFMDQFGALTALKDVAMELAEKDDWPSLYDPRVLSANRVPTAAVVYHDDMFVPADLSLSTARRIRGLEAWVTNEFEHDGLRSAGVRVFSELSARLASSASRLR